MTSTHATANFDSGRGRADLTTLYGRVAARLHRLRARSRRYHQVYDELAAYRDRELADLGITRADIPAIAREAAHAV